MGSWVQDKAANKIWLVCVKATFDIASDGTTKPSDDQVPLFIQGQPLDGDFEKSLIYESDFFGVKPCTDVLVNGTAWAPNGKPTTALDVGFRVGPVQKRLRVFGDRWWTVSLAGGRDVIASPEYFVKMPIRYEAALGGWDRSASNPKDHRLDDRNPVGQGLISNPNGRLGRTLPNIEDPANLVTTWMSRPEPAGFNAIACHWSPRRELAGTYDDTWMKTRFPLWAEDLDPRYYCCAPRDQQVNGYLKGGEPVQAINMSPDGPIRFSLPRLIFGFSTRLKRETIHHRGSLATVILEPDQRRLIMVWQGSLICNKDVDYLDSTTVRLKKLM
ncbi:DUF2169 family type VI secretion system accessory protein [Mesorhizobium sangaii]|nr:DUF2169 domain-containing protein [Mesorhizobium sangaii]